MDISEARELFEYASTYDQTNRDEALADMRFRAGEQWPDEERQQRELDNRPVLTIDRVGQFVRMVTGAARQNPPAIKVTPMDDPGGMNEQVYQNLAQMATIREGMVRNIEQRSNADQVYISGLDSATCCGIGYWRLVTEWNELDPFRQEIRIKRIPDPLSVLFDPDAVGPVREDAEYVFNTALMTPRSFKTKYPKAKDSSEWPRDDSRLDSQYWVTNETIRVAELFRRVPVDRTMLLLSSGEKADITDLEDADVIDRLERARAAGVDVLQEKKYKSHKVMRQIFNGFEQLEEEVEFPSRFLPIVPVLGEELPIGEQRVRRGLVRQARDPQKLYNYWRTTAAEHIALSPRAPFIATADQIGPYKGLWDAMNTTPRPYLLFQPDREAPGPPQRAVQSEPPAAMWQEAAVASDDLKAVTGIYDAALGAQSNETSGKAILARERQGQIGSAVYLDNLKTSIERTGEIILDMMPRVYDTEQTVQVISETGDAQPVRINQGPGGEINSMSKGIFGVKVSTGPSFESMREETAQTLMELIRVYPQLMNVAGDILIENLDFPRSDEVAERLQMLLQAQGQKPGDPSQDAKARRDLAEAGKTAAETEGITLENIAKEALLSS